MIKSIFFLILILLTSGMINHCYSQKYVLVWADEFNKPGYPDSTKWNYEKGLLRNTELQFYTEKRLENARIEDSVLILEARKESFSGANYTSASIRSKGTGDWLYGKIDIRAKVPAGKGSWPALWMMPTYSVYGGWPRSGEIDIMEYIGVEPQNLHYTCHFKGTNGSGHQASGKTTSAISNPYEKYIVYTLVWTPDKMEWFANGTKMHDYVRNSSDYRVWPFNKEFYLILNLAYGGKWGGYAGVDDTKLPHKFLIDYVRIYQLQDSPPPFTLTVPQVEGGKVEVSPQLLGYPHDMEVILRAVPDKDYIFKAWKHFSGANPFSIKINKNTVIEPLFVNSNELITNRTFDYGWTSWAFYVSNSQTASYNALVSNGIFNVNITKSPGVDWQLGFQELGLSMKKGNYKLSFEAYADQSKQLLVTISKNYPNWGEILNRRFSISTIPTRFESILNMPLDDNNVRLYFGLGNFLGNFFIDNISMQKMDNPNSIQFNEEPIQNGIKVYKDPYSGFVVAEISEFLLTENPVLEIMNINGWVVYRKTLTAMQNQLTEKFQTGVYFFRVKINSGIFTKKCFF